MAGLMYIATRDKGGWVKCPSVTMPSSKVGFNGISRRLNGTAYARRSKAAHKEYELTWNIMKRDEARPILDIADGLWGNGRVHFIDPIATDRNLLPQVWASPFQGIYDGLKLNGTSRPESVATPANTNDYPVESARYTVTTGVTVPRVWVPIPPGYTAWVGAHGTDGTGGQVSVRPTTGANTFGATTALTLLPVTSTTRVNASFDGSAYTGIELFLSGSGTVTLSGLMVQIFPTGVVGYTEGDDLPGDDLLLDEDEIIDASELVFAPPLGGFVSGQGNMGCRFETQPEYTPYSAGLDQVGMSVRLIEVDR